MNDPRSWVSRHFFLPIRSPFPWLSISFCDFDAGIVSGRRGYTQPAPQPEDPERSLDPASEEDPDIKVELIDGVFHQLSIDNALVAITADYPGIFPASQVTVTEVLIP